MPRLSPEELIITIQLCEQKIALLVQEGKNTAAVAATIDMLKGDQAIHRHDLVAAKMLYNASIDGFRRISMDTEWARVAVGAAEVFSAAGETETAVEFCDLAVEAVGALWLRTPLPNRVRVPEVIVRTFDEVIKIAHREKRDDRVFDYIQQAKARWLLDVTMFRQIERMIPIRKFAVDYKKREAVAKDLDNRLGEALAMLDARWNGYFNKGDSPSAIEEAENSVVERYGPATQTTFGGMQIRASATSLAEIQKRLGPDEVLLDFFVQSEGVYCAVVKSDFFKVFLQPVRAAELGNAALFAYLAVLQSEDRRVECPKARSAEIASILDVVFPDSAPKLEHIYDLLLRPFAAELVGVKRWIVCPHWHLHILPFHAMRPAAGSLETLIDTAAFVYAPSAAIWFRLAELGTDIPNKGSASHAVVMGIERKPPDWQALIRSFLQSIAGHEQISDFEAEAADIASEVEVTPIIGRAATKQVFFDGLASGNLVHVSCHTLLNRGNPLLEGLILADGIITLAEVLTTPRLDAARPTLVALSACRSAFGGIEPGDTFWGVGHGLLIRMGCPMLMSLWPVDAEATRLLMGEFYREGIATSDWALALQRAQCKVKQSRSCPDAEGRTVSFVHPYFWAGFFLVGAPLSALKDTLNHQ